MKSKEYYRLINKDKIKKISNKKDRDLDIFFECKGIINSKDIKIIALYYSKSLEVNSTELIKYALSNNKVVCLPRIRDGNNMDFIKIESLDNLEWNKTFNIKEPVFDKSNIIDSKNIDVMFVPLIGFDKYNHRLGYGKGYYDRYLKNNNNIVTFGLGYKETNIEENVFDELDISLQKIIFK